MAEQRCRHCEGSEKIFIAMSPMTPPRNLVVTKVHVTDKPYEVQLGAIRWIKTLVSTLVDTALATAVPVPAPLAPLVAPVDTAVDDPGDCSEDSLEETTTSTPKKDAPAGSVACADPSWDLSVEYQREEGGAPSLSLLGATNTTACSAALSTSAENSRASEQKRRKRPRTATQLGQDLYDVGAIVECFHAVRRIIGVFWPPCTAALNDICPLCIGHVRAPFR